MKLCTGATLSRKKQKGICIVYGCNNDSLKVGSICCKHKHQRQKENNPVRYHFDILRSNARRRGHEFNLTIDEFKQFCDETNYLTLKGRGCGRASIDRIDPTRGYERGNIQIMEYGDNVRKRFADERAFAAATQLRGDELVGFPTQVVTNDAPF